MIEAVDFGGKIVVVFCGEPSRGASLENVSVQQLGKRLFIVGQVVDDGSGAPVGMTCWYPVDELKMLNVYADVQAVRAAFASYDKRKAAHEAQKSAVSKKSGWNLW